MQKKILFVDDESALRRTMTLGLGQLGYETEPCENGMKALTILESYLKNNIPLDGIVVDLRLPDIDGLKLVKILKFKCPGVPIIVITGYADRYNLEEIRGLQVNAFLEKPFSPEELYHQFAAILAEHEEDESPEVHPREEKKRMHSAYLLLELDEENGFFETYQQLYNMENVVYCDAVKGDYDVFMLLQGENTEALRHMAENRIKPLKGVRSVEFLDVSVPVLPGFLMNIIQDAETALENENDTLTNRDMSSRVCSYLLLEVQEEKLDRVYPALRLNEQVVYCDHTGGKYNLVLLVTAATFEEIDRLTSEKITGMEGVVKVKEYPIVTLFEM